MSEKTIRRHPRIVAAAAVSAVVLLAGAACGAKTRDNVATTTTSAPAGAKELDAPIRCRKRPSRGRAAASSVVVREAVATATRQRVPQNRNGRQYCQPTQQWPGAQGVDLAG